MTDKTLNYFAYGSNMSRARLQARLGQVDVIGIAQCAGYQMLCHKKGKDGSGKCNIIAKKGAHVWGVLYQIKTSQKPQLDAFEGLGLGYDIIELTLTDANTKPIKGYAYHAMQDYVDDQIKPFDWYLDFVVAGAIEHELPKYYRDALMTISAIIDPDHKRRKRNQHILNGLADKDEDTHQGQSVNSLA